MSQSELFGAKVFKEERHKQYVREKNDFERGRIDSLPDENFVFANRVSMVKTLGSLMAIMDKYKDLRCEHGKMYWHCKECK